MWEQKLRRAGKSGQEDGEGGEKMHEAPWVLSLPHMQEGSPQELCRGEGPRTSHWPCWLASSKRSSKVRSCPVPNYSVVMQELAEITLCLRNLDDEHPPSTDPSHQVNETIHPMCRNPASGSVEQGSGAGVGVPTEQVARSPVCVLWPRRGSSSGMCWGLC